MYVPRVPRAVGHRVDAVSGRGHSFGRRCTTRLHKANVKLAPDIRTDRTPPEWHPCRTREAESAIEKVRADSSMPRNKADTRRRLGPQDRRSWVWRGDHKRQRSIIATALETTAMPQSDTLGKHEKKLICMHAEIVCMRVKSLKSHSQLEARR
ncbi:hypothetical protein MRX96_043075 [Rhipicephalus microplus]